MALATSIPALRNALQVVALEEGARAEVVDENAHAHAALMGLEERGGHLVGLAARMPDVELHVD